MNENGEQRTTVMWLAELPSGEFKDYVSMIVSSTGVLLNDVPVEQLEALNTDPLDRAAINKLIFETRDQVSTAHVEQDSSTTEPPASSVLEQDRFILERSALAHNLDQRIARLGSVANEHLRTAERLQRELSMVFSRLHESRAELEALEAAGSEAKPIVEQIAEIEAAGFWEFVGIHPDSKDLWFHTRRNIHLTYINPAAGINQRQDTGQFALSVPTQTTDLSAVRCIPTFRTVGATGANSPHPHTSSGNLCWGDGTDRASAARMSGDLVKFVSLVQALLTTYEPSNPYISLAQMNRVHSDQGYEDGFNLHEIIKRDYVRSINRSFLADIMYPRLTVDPNMGIEKSLIDSLNLRVKLFGLYRKNVGSNYRYTMPYSTGSGGVVCVRLCEKNISEDISDDLVARTGRIRETYDMESFQRYTLVDDESLRDNLLSIFGQVLDRNNDGATSEPRGRLRWGTFIASNGSSYGEWMIGDRVLRLSAVAFVNEAGVVFKTQNEQGFISTAMSDEYVRRKLEEQDWDEDAIDTFMDDAWGSGDSDWAEVFSLLEDERYDHIDSAPDCGDCGYEFEDLDPCDEGIIQSRERTAGWICPDCGYHNT